MLGWPGVVQVCGERECLERGEQLDEARGAKVEFFPIS